MKGDAGINMFWIVPKDKEAEVDAMFMDHMEFMNSGTHVYKGDGDDSKAARLNNYYISKGNEKADWSKGPDGEETGNVVYVMVESYVSPEGIKKHIELATASWPGLPKLQEYVCLRRARPRPRIHRVSHPSFLTPVASTSPGTSPRTAR